MTRGAESLPPRARPRPAGKKSEFGPRIAVAGAVRDSTMGGMKTLPPPDEMYRALLERDETYEGSFLAAIRTTGIFCRPGCRAKKPRRENVEFFADPNAAMRAGYRPCLRCRPLESGRETPAKFGMTPRAYERTRRLDKALERIRGGSSVTDAALESGFESESGFRDAFVRIFGAPPTRAVAAGASVLRVRWLPSPLGPLLAAATEEGVCLLEFADRRALPTQIATLRRRFPFPVVPGSHRHLDQLAQEMSAYFAGERPTFEVELVAPGTPFQAAVWDLLRRIPPGETRSYAEIAREVGRPSAVRAVARANGENRLAILIPCHRVIGSDGSPTGYGGGIWRKQWLLAHEREMAAVG
jgi:AraC family transcriptional regulator of adaptative response/methylated-DNA-[protein]-cysteine methyltransferase